MAAPSKLTPENRVKIKEAAALDASVEEMAYYCDVSKQTIYNWFEDEPELFDEIERLRQRPILKARKTVDDSLSDPNHAFRFLEKKRRKEFGNSLDVTSDNEKLTINLIKYDGDNNPA